MVVGRELQARGIRLQGTVEVGFPAVHLRESEPLDGRQVGQRQRLAARPRMPRRHDADATVAQQGVAVKTRRHFAEQADGNVQPLGVQVVGHEIAVHGLEAQRNARRQSMQPFQQGSGQQDFTVRAGTDVDDAAGPRGIESFGGSQRRFDLRQRVVHRGVQLQRPLGRDEAPFPHHQQRILQPPAQARQIAADGGLRLVQQGRTGRGAAGTHQHVEGQQQVHVQPPQIGQGLRIAHP
ncbi:hypothetical protein G6F68_010997 [Rhizopus microsporus]|nr:hypothetical protein G6F68_010997 [Rhizopus microsporus]